MNYMKNRLAVILLITLISIGTSACGKTFHGKVVDAETKKPVEEAIIVASWNESTATISGGSAKFKDAREVLTDKNGEWQIRGPKGDRIISQFLAIIPGVYYTEAPEFIIFKPGYCSYPKGFTIEACKEKIRPYGIGDGEITELPKLTRIEDRLKSQRIWPLLMNHDKESLVRIKKFVKLLNKEKRFLHIPVKEIKGDN